MSCFVAVEFVSSQTDFPSVVRADRTNGSLPITLHRRAGESDRHRRRRHHLVEFPFLLSVSCFSLTLADYSL